MGPLIVNSAYATYMAFCFLFWDSLMTTSLDSARGCFKGRILWGHARISPFVDQTQHTYLAFHQQWELETQCCYQWAGDVLWSGLAFWMDMQLLEIWRSLIVVVVAACHCLCRTVQAWQCSLPALAYAGSPRMLFFGHSWWCNFVAWPLPWLTWQAANHCWLSDRASPDGNETGIFSCLLAFVLSHFLFCLNLYWGVSNSF